MWFINNTAIEPASPVSPALLMGSLPAEPLGKPFTHDLITSQRTHLLMLSPWGLRFYMEIRVSLMAQGVKNLSANAGDPGSIPGSGRSPGERMATHSSILAWEMPWTGKPGGLESMGSQRVRHDWVIKHVVHFWETNHILCFWGSKFFASYFQDPQLFTSWRGGGALS